MGSGKEVEKMVEESWTKGRLIALMELESKKVQLETIVVDRLERILREEYGLSQLGLVVVHKWLHKMATDASGLEHVRDWFLLLVNQGKGRNKLFSPWQAGCPDLIPRLRQQAFWDLPSLCALVESKFERVKEEVLHNRNQPMYQPYRAPNWANPQRVASDGMGSLGHESGSWDVCYLFLHNVDFDANCAFFPETVELIRSIPRWYRHAFISVMSPNTHIAKHNGPTNKKLRLHLPIVVPSGGHCAIRVGSETRTFEESKCILFDDSFEHEAWNRHPTDARICLIIDLWHPDLSDREVNLLTFLEKGKMKRAKSLCSQASTEGDDFYSILDHTKTLAKPLADI